VSGYGKHIDNSSLKRIDAVSLPNRAVISTYVYPSTIHADCPSYFAVSGYIDNSTGEYDFYVGISYLDGGPAASISSPCGDLPVNETCYDRFPNRNKGTIGTHQGDYKFPMDGKYPLQFEAGYILGSTLVTTSTALINIDVKPVSADCARVDAYGITQAVFVNDPRDASVTAKVLKSTGGYDFFAGIQYVDGPASSITTSKCGTLSKGRMCYQTAPSRNVNTLFDYSDNYTFPVAGRYTIRFAAGYISGGTPIVTNSYDYPLDVYKKLTSLALTVQQL